MRSHLFRRLVAAGLLLVLQATVFGQEQRAVLDLIVNQVPHGEVLVILRDADALLAVSALEEAGLHGFSGRVEPIADVDFVSLASIKGLAFEINERDLRLVIAVDPRMLGDRSRNLGIGEPRNLVHGNDTSGFVNYALNWSDHTGADLLTESALNARGALVYNTLTARAGSVVRGLSSVTIDDRSAMRRWSFGDTFSQAGLLGGSALIAGVSVSREFSVAPYYVRHPSLSLTTPVTVPSVVEVRVNDRLVSQEQVAPGQLVLENLPLTSGRNDARITVRDVFGGVRELVSGYYLTTSGLARGVQDYQYIAGWKRNDLGARNWNYTTPAFLARHRIGVTDLLTVGGRAEAMPGVASGGPSANLRLPFGEVEMAAGVSRVPAGVGSAFTLSYMYGGRRASAGGGVMLASDRYENVNERRLDERSSIEWNAFGSVPIASRANLGIQHNWAQLQDGTSRLRASMLSMIRLGGRTDFSASMTRVHDERGSRREVFMGVTMTMGRVTSTASLVRDVEGSRSVVEVQQPLPVGVGYGFQLRTAGGARDAVAGVVQYQSSHGRYEVRREGLDGDYHSTITASGSLVGIGGGIFTSRPVQSSFALVQVPGVEGVRAFSSNQEVGRTDKHGNLLIPDLQPYYGNLLAIADTDVPMQYSLSDVGVTLAPPYRGGAVALFPVRRAQRASGTVVLSRAAGEIVPVYGELRVESSDEDATSPIGTGGEFFLEHVEPGRHDAVIEFDGTLCRFVLDVPQSDAPITKLGRVVCQLTEAP